MLQNHRMRKFKRIIAIVGVLYMLMISMLHFFQEKLIFLPTQLAQDYEFTFSEPFQEIFLETRDGARLNALHFQQEHSKGLLLYFHGNAGDLSRWGHMAVPFTKQSYDVLIMDYRTYGKSSGKLSEQSLFNDAQQFYDYALQYYSESQIHVYGRSLGTGIATKIAATNSPKQLILETPYYSLVDVAQKRFPFLPVNWLLKYKLKSHDYMKSVRCPITIFHGTEDEIVPYSSGERLFNAIMHSPKKMYTIEKGSHNNLADFDLYQKGMQATLTDILIE